MKKIASIFAVVVMSLGMFSCTTDSKEDSALYDIQDHNSAPPCDNCHAETDKRGG